MSRRRTVWAGVASTMLAAGLVAIVLASTAEAGDRDTRHETIRLHDTTTATSLVDLNHNSVPEPGDSLLFHEEDRRSGNVVEYNDSQCVVALADTYLCHVVVSVVDRGEVDLDGSIPAPGGAFPADFDIGITGGTGDFARARGYGHVHQTSDSTAEDTLVVLP